MPTSSSTITVAALLLLTVVASVVWYRRQLRCLVSEKRSRPLEHEAAAGSSSGALVAATAAAAADCWPWNLPGGSYTELQAATARLATAALLHERLAAPTQNGRNGQKTLAGTAHVSGLADLLELIGERLVPRSESARLAAEAAAYRPGWAGPAWMDTSDACGGFRPLVHFPQFRLAVSATGRLQGDVVEVCPAPDGWRIATSAEIMAAGMRRFAPTKAPKQYYYMDQAGWTCCTWPERSRNLPEMPWGTRGIERIYFVTADWATVEPANGGALHAQYTEGTLTGSFTSASLRRDLPNGLFGGIVCVRDDVRCSGAP